MASFRYKAKDRQGRTMDGVAEGADQRAVVADLQRQGYYVLDVREAPAGREPLSSSLNPAYAVRRWLYNPIFGGATIAQLAFFYRQLATMMKAGMTLVQAMSSLRARGGNRRLRRIAGETMEHLQNGGRLSDALARYPWMFPEVHVHLLRAGEAGGTLDRMIERIADMLDQEHRLRQKLRLATLYPKILVLAVIFIPAFPVLIFQGWRQYLHDTVGVMIPVIVALLAAWAMYRILYQLAPFRYGVDVLKLAVPKVGKIVRWSAQAKFYRVLAAMMAAGAPLSQGLGHAANASGNWFLAARLKRAIPGVERGRSLADSLAETRALPETALDMLATGEQTGSVDAMLDKVAEYTENEAELATLQSTVILGVLLLLGIAAYIGMFVVGFYQGHYSDIANQTW